MRNIFLKRFFYDTNRGLWYSYKQCQKRRQSRPTLFPDLAQRGSMENGMRVNKGRAVTCLCACMLGRDAHSRSRVHTNTPHTNRETRRLQDCISPATFLPTRPRVGEIWEKLGGCVIGLVFGIVRWVRVKEPCWWELYPTARVLFRFPPFTVAAKNFRSFRSCRSVWL